VQGLHSQNPQEQYEATQWFRKLLSIGEHVLVVLGLGLADYKLQAGCTCRAAGGTAVAAAVAFANAAHQHCMHATDHARSSSRWHSV
jgi:hypothetical protein